MTGQTCPWCLTVFAPGSGLLHHSRGRCSEGNPVKPRNDPSRRMECGHCSVRHTPRCTTPTWPVAPLLALCGGTEQLAARLDMNHEKILSAQISGLDDYKADRWAIRCGHHPGSIWPEWVDAGLTLRDELFVNDGGWRPAWAWATA